MILQNTDKSNHGKRDFSQNFTETFRKIVFVRRPSTLNC